MKNSKEVADKIIEKYSGNLESNDNGFGINLDHIIGVSFGSDKKKKADAIKDIKQQLESILKDGSLDLSESFLASL